MAPNSARRMSARLAGSVLSVLLVLAGVAAGARPLGAATTAAAPARWDPQIEPIAREVEHLRKLDFEHPVPVRFLSEAEFEKRQRADRSKLSKSDEADLERAQAQLRALGLIGQDVDLFDASNDIGSTDVLAYYDPGTGRITVKGKATDTLEVATKVTLAHELTHALQDQHFRLARVQRLAAKHHAPTAARAVIEGDAVRIQNLYEAQLSDADQQAYDEQSRAQTSEARADAAAKSIPPALLAFFEAPYAFGPSLVQVAEADVDGGVDGLFRKPPTNDAAYLTPSTLVDGSKFTTVPRPRARAGEKVVGKPDVFGAFALYVVLASRLGPADALAVADGWGGDAMITLEREGRTCVRATFVGRDAARTSAISDALAQWRDAMPAGAATVDGTGRRVTLTACDTATAVSPTPHGADEATTFAANRDALYGVLVKQGAPSKVADCAANGLVRDPGFAPFLADPNATPDDATIAQLRSLAQDITRRCVAESAA